MAAQDRARPRGRTRRPRPTSSARRAADAAGRWRAGSAWPIGMIGAPKKPWATRARISVSRLFASPHRNEETVKPSTVKNIRLRQPSRLDSQPVIGVATRGGHQVERDDPGDLVLGGREGAAHLRQHQVGERDGHAEQHVRQLHHQQDEPLPAADAEEAALRNRSAHLGDVSSCRRGLLALLPDLNSRFACKMGRPRRGSALRRVWTANEILPVAQRPKPPLGSNTGCLSRLATPGRSRSQASAERNQYWSPGTS